MVTASYINRLSQAVEQIETRLKQRRSWKVVTVRRGYKEDPEAALDRHYAAHPEDRGANVTIFKFYDDKEMACESQVRNAPARPACEDPKDRGPRRY